jgi:excisionase family DNA binding protein
MMQKFLTSAEVADLIKVNVSTIKRWTNEGELKCTRTLGKHRKYKIQDIIEFAKVNSLDINPFTIFSEKEKNNDSKKIGFAIYTEDYETLSNNYYRYISNGDKNKAERFLKIIYRSKISLEIIYDNVISPALRKIGKQWVNHEIGIETEHLASNIVLHSIIKLQDAINKKELNGFISICGCLSEEYHNIAITCVNNLLESEGWKSYFLGNNTPANSFIKSIGFYKPKLICISSTHINNKEQFIKDVNSIYKHAKKNGSFLAVSGEALIPSIKSEIKFDYSPSSAIQTLQMIKAIENGK